jgi:6-pyruvoyltetrahydropterin/6-carboxytetrahydropterin synthase
MYYSTKRIGPISTGHRQWRDKGHCKWAHGYGRYVKFTFACKTLDERMWCMDFGDLKWVKKWLEDQWDHRMLIASDDPYLKLFKELHEMDAISMNVMDVTKGWGPGIEASCKFVFDNINPKIQELTNNRVWIDTVEIYEHEFNSAFYVNGAIETVRCNNGY